MQQPIPLDDHLALRAVETDADAEKVIAINGSVHGPDVGHILRHWMFGGHPSLLRSDWLFVEDQRTDQVMATLAFMPLTWCYGGHPLPVAELGFVATLPDYRRGGLQRRLSATFDQMALSRGYTVAAIEGIPGFYGQFGYEYAVPLGGGCDLEFAQVSGETLSTQYAMRTATLADVPDLQGLYDASVAGLDLTAPRDAALWAHQVTVPQETMFYGRTTVIEADGRIVGYLRWNDDDWSDRLRILELAVDDGLGARERVLAALRYARDAGRSGGKRGLRLELPQDHPALALARHLGATERRHYGWQMKMLDPSGFMKCIAPALELRLGDSMLAGYSGSIVFDLYRSHLALRFETGKLAHVDALPPESAKTPADARMTLKQATQLWLGWRGREALEAWYPDFWSRDQVRHLLDVLFPKARAHIYMPY